MMSIAVRGREDLPWAEYPVLAVGAADLEVVVYALEAHLHPAD